MLRTIVLFAFEFLYVGLSALYVPYYKYLCKRDPLRAEGFVYGLVTRWAVRSLAVAGANIEVRGEENLLPDDMPAIYVGNHQSMADIPLVLSRMGRPKGIISKGEMGKHKIFALWMKAFRCVFVDREDPRKAAAAMREASEHVEAGYPMVIFAEGTRSRNGEIAEFKAGAFRIAQKSKVPVVPFCIEGTGGLFEYNKKVLNPKSKVILHILPAVDTSEYTRDDWKDLPGLCEKMIKEKLSFIRNER